jgi:3',5'-cyclic AMP phosphodiesterase CpdA
VIVQLTDMHIGPPGSRPYGVDTAAQFREVARVVRAMDLEPAAVLLTGDLSDEGEPESYEHLRELVADELDPIGAPVLSVVGNHDHRASFRAAYLGETDPSDDEPYHYVVDLAAVRLVMADSYVAGKVSGRLGDRQLAWIDEQLADAGDRLPIVAVHHPAVPRGVPRPDDYLLEDRDAFGDVIIRHEVGAVLCGHGHVTTAATFAGTLHVAAPATAYLLDPSRRRGGRGYVGAGFSICTVRDGQAIVNPHLLSMNGTTVYEH